jgi:hypothetical protein
MAAKQAFQWFRIATHFSTTTVTRDFFLPGSSQQGNLVEELTWTSRDKEVDVPVDNRTNKEQVDDSIVRSVVLFP